MQTALFEEDPVPMALFPEENAQWSPQSHRAHAHILTQYVGHRNRGVSALGVQAFSSYLTKKGIQHYCSTVNVDGCSKRPLLYARQSMQAYLMLTGYFRVSYAIC